MSNNSQAIKDLENRLRGAMLRLPKLVGNEVVNFSKQRFKEGCLLGNTFERWPAH